MRENLIYHDANGGFASYGRDGGPGRDIMIAPSCDHKADRTFFKNISAPETTVVSVLNSPNSIQITEPLSRLMREWDKLEKNFGAMIVAKSPADFLHTFEHNFMRDLKRHKIQASSDNEKAIKVLKDAIAESLDLAAPAFNQEQRVAMVMMHYPASSRVVPNFHHWHNDANTAKDKIVLQHSMNVGGLRFKFKEQASIDKVTGVAFSPSRVMFKVREDNYHYGCPVSPNEGRLMYTLTGIPSPAVAM